MLEKGTKDQEIFLLWYVDMTNRPLRGREIYYDQQQSVLYKMIVTVKMFCICYNYYITTYADFAVSFAIIPIPVFPSKYKIVKKNVITTTFCIYTN